MSLLEYEDVHICGNVLDHDLVIPTNVLELECFMDGQVLAVLLSLRVCDFFNLVSYVMVLVARTTFWLTIYSLLLFIGCQSTSCFFYRLDVNWRYND